MSSEIYLSLSSSEGLEEREERLESPPVAAPGGHRQSGRGTGGHIQNSQDSQERQEGGPSDVSRAVVRPPATP